jgi:alpha-mannosidase
MGKTDSPKRLRGMRLQIEFAPNRPDPRDLYDEFVSSAVLIPSLDAVSLPTLDHAISDVDLKALDQANQEAFDASLRKAITDLEPIHKILSKATFHLTGNSHIDAAWLWPWTETVDVVKRTFGTAAQLMNEYPTYTFTQSAAQYNTWIADKYPDINEQITQRIKEGRWEVVGGMWVEPTSTCPMESRRYAKS